MKKMIIFSTLLVLGACANLQTNSNVADQMISKQSDKKAIQKIQKLAYACKGCIVGSATPESIKESGLESYILKGSLAKKLKNTVFDIPVEYNSKVRKWIDFYTKKSSGRRSFLIHAERAGQYAPVMSEIMAQKGLPRDLVYLAMAESGFRNDAVSWASAVGPWQFMSYTGKKFGLKVNWHLDQRKDPLKATVAAGEYLSYLKNYFGDWKLAMAGYNAGEGKVGRAIKRYKTKNFWKLIRGRYLKPETKNYVPKIMALAIIGKNLEYFGFTDRHKITPKELVSFETIKVAPKTDLFKVAKALKTNVKNIKKLNPEINRWYTPLKTEYRLRVPVGSLEDWSESMFDDFRAKDYQTYTIKKGANLKNIARLYKVPVKVLEKLNGISKNKRLPAKKVVKLPFRIGQNRRKDPMYADLYKPKVTRKSLKRKRRVNKYRRLIRKAMRKGKRIRTPRKFYTVKKGDTLWTVARVTGVGMNTIIRSNHRILKKRMIRPGDRLAIR